MKTHSEEPQIKHQFFWPNRDSQKSFLYWYPQMKKEFMDLLKDSDFIDRHSSWSDVKKKIENDPRFKVVESSREREDFFIDYIHELKEEHRREKERKKRRSRSRSKGRSRHSRYKSYKTFPPSRMRILK